RLGGPPDVPGPRRRRPGGARRAFPTGSARLASPPDFPSRAASRARRAAMSDLPDPPELPRPVAVHPWRVQLDGLVDALGLTPARLAASAVAVCVIGVLGWRLFASVDEPPEMRIPFADAAAAPSADAAAGGDGGPSAEAGAAPAGAASAGGEGGRGRGPARSAHGVGTGGGGDRPGAAEATDAAELVVHGVGAVASPGVQRLPAGSRVVDALEAAGGPTAEADLARLNLAAPLSDGQQVYVVRVGEDPPLPPAGAVPGSHAGPDGSAPVALVDLNTATAEQLETLPGVGPATASAILAHRQQAGPFSSVDQLIEVRGIGEVKLAQLRDLVTVSGAG